MPILCLGGCVAYDDSCNERQSNCSYKPLIYSTQKVLKREERNIRFKTIYKLQVLFP